MTVSSRPPASSPNARATMRANRPTSNLELGFRRALFHRGIRGYRIRSSLPGRPDIAFPRARLAVFIHGCFWHGCDICDLPRPKANAVFWRAKLEENRARDVRVATALGEIGWTSLVIWEHEIRLNTSAAIDRIAAFVAGGTHARR